MINCPEYTLKLTLSFDRVLKKLKRRNPQMWRALEHSIAKVVKEPLLGKPLGNVLRNYRRVHIEGSFVLIYEIKDCEIRFTDFDHHDRIYKKYS